MNIAEESLQIPVTGAVLHADVVVPGPLPPKARPSETLYSEQKMTFGGEQVEYGYLLQAHTDGDINAFLRDYGNDIKYVNHRKDIYDITRAYISGAYGIPDKKIIGLHGRLNGKFSNSIDFARITGLAFVNGYRKLGIRASTIYKGPSYQITKMRLVSRVGPTGTQLNQVVISLVQKAGAKFKDGVYEPYTPTRAPFSKIDDTGKEIPADSFEFRGGCTLIFDLDSQLLKYAINKPILDMESLEPGHQPMINRRRLDSQHKYMHDDDSGRNEFTAYFGSGLHKLTEPFAFLHQI